MSLDSQSASAQLSFLGGFRATFVHRRQFCLLPLAFAAFLSLVAPTARADVTYTFTGTVTHVDPSLSGTFNTSMTLSGSFTYNSNTPGILSGSETAGFSIYRNALTDFVMKVGSYTASPPFGTDISSGMDVVNNWGTPTFSGFTVASRLTGTQFNGFNPIGGLFFYTSDAGVFSDTKLVDVGDLSGWTARHSGAFWYLAFDCCGGQPGIGGVITSITASSTIDFTDRAAFAAATSNLTTVGFTGILPPGVRFGGYSQLDIPGISFSTPIPGTFVDVTASDFYSPNSYPGDFIVDSVSQITGLPNPNNTLVISLASPTFAVGLDLGGLGFSGAGSATITLSNGHVFSLSSLPTVGHTTFVGFLSTVPITTLTIQTTSDSWVVEDLVLASEIPPSNCTISLLPGGQGFGPQGGLGSFTINTAAGCRWGLTFNANWLFSSMASPGGGTPRGTGTSKVTFAVAANNGAGRFGSISVGNQNFNVDQLGGGGGQACTFSISPPHTVLDDTGGDVRVVITSPSGCQSTAVSNAAWLSVTSGASGAGTRPVVLHAAANMGGARSGTATIAGSTFTVSQGAGACGALDVSSETRVQGGGLNYLPFSTYLYTGMITVINTSAATLHPPLFVVLVGLPNHFGYPAGNGVYGSAQTTCFTTLGDAMYLLPVGDLLPGRSTQISPLFFTQSLFGGLPYYPRVLSGTPTK